MSAPRTRNKKTSSPGRKKRLPSAKEILLAWPGVVPRFSRLREGGPGRPVTLLVVAALVIALGYQGFRLLDQTGIDGSGPAMMFISVFLLAGLGVWVLIKAGLRGREVRFVLSEGGVEVQPSKRQQDLDRRMRTLALLSFFLTWKGGQWAAWKPYIRWIDVREVRFNNAGREIVVLGPAWNIRLQCTAENFEQAVEIIRSRAGLKAAGNSDTGARVKSRLF